MCTINFLAVAVILCYVFPCYQNRAGVLGGGGYGERGKLHVYGGAVLLHVAVRVVGAERVGGVDDKSRKHVEFGNRAVIGFLYVGKFSAALHNLYARKVEVGGVLPGKLCRGQTGNIAHGAGIEFGRHGVLLRLCGNSGGAVVFIVHHGAAGGGAVVSNGVQRVHGDGVLHVHRKPRYDDGERCASFHFAHVKPCGSIVDTFTVQIFDCVGGVNGAASVGDGEHKARGVVDGTARGFGLFGVKERQAVFGGRSKLDIGRVGRRNVARSFNRNAVGARSVPAVAARNNQLHVVRFFGGKHGCGRKRGGGGVCNGALFHQRPHRGFGAAIVGCGFQQEHLVGYGGYGNVGGGPSVKTCSFCPLTAKPLTL